MSDVSELLIGILTICFVVLKLTGVISWSWWWVLSPLWIGIVIAVFIAIVVYLIMWIKEKVF